MAHQEIKAVLFDLGDTLLNFGRISTTGVFLRGLVAISFASACASCAPTWPDATSTR